MTWHEGIPLEYRDAIVTGDALRILPLLPEDCIDAVVTDPPYSSGGQFRGDRMASTVSKYVQSGQRTTWDEFSGDNRDQRAFTYWCTLWLVECWRVAKPGAVLCVFSDWRQLPSMTDAVQAAGWTWRGLIAWDKTEGARPQKGRFRSQCEYIVWASKGPMPEPRESDPCLPGVFRVVVKPADKFHIAGKPTELMAQLLGIVRTGVVLDPFAGSGSTLVAAKQLGLEYIGIELNPPEAQRARERVAATQPPLFVVEPEQRDLFAALDAAAPAAPEPEP